MNISKYRFKEINRKTTAMRYNIQRLLCPKPWMFKCVQYLEKNLDPIIAIDVYVTCFSYY